MTLQKHSSRSSISFSTLLLSSPAPLPLSLCVSHFPPFPSRKIMSALMQRVRTLGAHEVGHTLGEARRGH